MRLKTNIFVWLLLATAVPLTALTLGATVYSEYLYRRGVEQDINTALNSLVGEIGRRLETDRETIRGLATVPAVTDYLPVLQAASRGALHPAFQPLTDRLGTFLEAFRGIVPGFGVVRVLDASANTLVKVTAELRSPNLFDGIESYPYAEEELDNVAFPQNLAGLESGEVAAVVLPQTRESRVLTGSVRGLPDYVLPLTFDGATVGYLAVTPSGGQVDRILDFAPRFHQGQLFISELNPDDPVRDGVLLFDDAAGTRFSIPDNRRGNLAELMQGRLLTALADRPYGVVEGSARREVVHYTEFLPYPNQLVSWLVGIRLDAGELAAPFSRIRLAIFVFALLAVLLSLGLAWLGARTVAAPVMELAASLKAFADGSRERRKVVGGIEELRQLEQSFNYMVETLERARAERDQAEQMAVQSAKLASLGQLAAGIGHEINNPLNNILSLAKLAERSMDDDPERTRSDLQALRDETLRASRIVRDILNFARQVAPRRGRFDARPWVDECCGLIRQMAARERIRIDTGRVADVTIDGDRNQLQQVLVNLLLNAVQASPAQGTVTVAARSNGTAVEVEVRDHGSGLTEEARERMFDPFFSTKAVGEGTGLGLSISLGIVERHGGSLDVRDHPDGGVVATLRLPPCAETRQDEAC